MPQREYIPMNWAVFAAWMANYVLQLGVLKTKYNIPTDKIEALSADNTWVQFWAEAREKAKQQNKQVTDFVDGIRKGRLGAPVLTNPVWNLGTMPATVLPGIHERIREVANFIKAQKSIYSISDGELLGIVTAEEAGKAENEYIPALKLETESNYNLDTDFRLFGTDALRVEYRFKGGDWQLAAILTRSPGTFHIIPTTPGEAQTVEIRAVFIVNSQPFGQYSPIYSTIIKP